MDALKASHEQEQNTLVCTEIAVSQSVRVAIQHNITTAAFDHGMMQQQHSGTGVHLLHDLEGLVRGELGIDVLSVDGLHSNIQLAHHGLVHLQVCTQRCD